LNRGEGGRKEKKKGEERTRICRRPVLLPSLTRERCHGRGRERGEKGKRGRDVPNQLQSTAFEWTARRQKKNRGKKKAPRQQQKKEGENGMFFRDSMLSSVGGPLRRRKKKRRGEGTLPRRLTPDTGTIHSTGGQKGNRGLLEHREKKRERKVFRPFLHRERPAAKGGGGEVTPRLPRVLLRSWGRSQHEAGKFSLRFAWKGRKKDGGGRGRDAHHVPSLFVALSLRW